MLQESYQLYKLGSFYAIINIDQTTNLQLN